MFTTCAEQLEGPIPTPARSGAAGQLALRQSPPEYQKSYSHPAQGPDVLFWVLSHTRMGESKQVILCEVQLVPQSLFPRV